MDQIFQIGNLFSDFLGLLITLNISVLGAIVTIAEKVFTVEKILKSIFNKVLFLTSISCFIASLLLSILVLASIPSNIANILQNKSNLLVAELQFQGAIWSFFVGIFLFVVLAIFVFFELPKKKSLLRSQSNVKHR